MALKVYYSRDQQRFERMNRQELHDSFLIHEWFNPDRIDLFYSEVDRAVVGSIVPLKNRLCLEAPEMLSCRYFAERREIGVLNIGNSGAIVVDRKTYQLQNRDILYIGRGSQEISFTSSDARKPARFYLSSYPAHQNYPTKLCSKADANQVHLGSQSAANERTIFQYIHEKGIRSCQLVMGITELEPGCVWNTMPPHTHLRRSEIYMYFDVSNDAVVFHLMGRPDEIKTLVVRNEQAVISPLWSFHSGVGTRNYSFVWTMGGENQSFEDMDHIQIDDLR